MKWLVACDRTAADSLGGMTVTLLETGKIFLRSGDSVHWVTGRANDSIPDLGFVEGIHTYSFPAYKTGLSNLLRMRSEFRSHISTLLEEPGVEAAIIHQPIVGEAVGSLLREKGIPCCYFFHSPWAHEFLFQRKVRVAGLSPALRLREYIEDRAVRSFDRIAVFSRTMAELLHSEHPRAAPPTIITPGIDLERFHPVPNRRESRRRLNWPVDDLLLLVVRRMVPRMGLDLLIRAFHLITPSLPDVRLLIGGSGPLRYDLETLTEELGISDRVLFLGYIPDDDLAEAYGAADLVIMPTRALEGLGLVTLEAMACGTAVVATPVGGNVELLEPFRPELIAGSVSHEEMAYVLRDVISGGKESVEQLGLEARSHVESRYGWDRTASDLRTVLGVQG